jgi:hypothetical protein
LTLDGIGMMTYCKGVSRLALADDASLAQDDANIGVKLARPSMTGALGTQPVRGIE